jgi:hypothetical protein
MIGTADYAKDFVKANRRLRETFAGGVRVVHGVPFLIGGTGNTAALMTMAEINQWVTQLLPDRRGGRQRALSLSAHTAGGPPPSWPRGG